MIILKKWPLFALLLANAITLNACSNSSAGNKQANSVNANAQVNSEANASLAELKSSTNVQAELDKAKKAGKVVFVVVTGNGVADVDKAVAIVKKANTTYKNAVVVQLNKDDAANSELVSKWRLAGAPLPLILVVSPKGFPAGGYVLNEATAQNIVDLVPSPKMDDVYEAMSNSKSVFLVISKKTFTDRTKILENCKSAVSQLKNKAAIVEIDLADKNETEFIKKLNIKNTPNTSSVMVLNASGQTTGSFEGSVETNQLVLAANKVVKSGCCSSGSSCK